MAFLYGYFIDSGTPESYLEANFKCLGNNGTASHPGASIRELPNT